MNEVIAQLASPVWWFTVVLVGIAINLVSAYCKPLVDRIGGGTWDWWRRSSVKRAAAASARLKLLRESASAREKAKIMVLREALMSVSFMLMAIFILCLELWMQAGVSPGSALDNRIKTVVFAAAAFAWFASYLALNRSIRERVELFRALDSLEDGQFP